MGSEHVTAFTGSNTIEVKLAGEQLEGTLTTLQTFVGAGLAHVGGTVSGAAITTGSIAGAAITTGTIDGAAIGATTPCQARVYPPDNAQTGTTYTLALADLGKVVTLSNASAITLTVPTNASVAFPVGSVIVLAQIGAGLVTVAAAGGVTVSQVAGTLKMLGQYSVVTLRKVATDSWLANGDLSAT